MFNILRKTFRLLVILTIIKFDILSTQTGVKKLKNSLKTISFKSSCRFEHFFILANIFTAKYFKFCYLSRAEGVRKGARGYALLPLTFLRSKKKKGGQRQNKKEKVSKQKLSKRCHQGQNIIVLAILEGLEFEWWMIILFSIP